MGWVTDAAWRLDSRAEVASTQDIAIAAAHDGLPGRSAFTAGRQTAGRGRDGRVWRAPEGNLNFSALLRPGPVRPVAAQWSLMAGVAIFDAIGNEALGEEHLHPETSINDRRFGGGGAPSPTALTLKWPNDLLLGRKKLAGVLIDSALTEAGLLDWVVIGIGANLAEAPSLPDRETTCLADHGINMPPDILAARLMQALDRWAAEDLPAIRAAWLSRAHSPGTPLRVHQGGRVIEGIFDGLGLDGSLLLRGHPPIASGETVLIAPHASGR